MKVFIDANIFVDIFNPDRLSHKDSLLGYQHLVKNEANIYTSCDLMLNDSEYKDLEDALQYIMAQKQDCDFIISNDKNFVSKDIELLTSKAFCQKFIV